MAFQTIGDINLAIADQRAGSIERKSEDLQTLGSNIGGSVNNALESASVLQKQAIDEQMQKEANNLLKSGVDGVNQYVQELNSQGAELDPIIYANMAKTAKDPKNLQPIYMLANKTANKNMTQKKQFALMSGIGDRYKDVISTADPEKIAKFGNEINILKTQTVDKETIKQLESIEKGLNDYKARSGKNAKPGDATKGLLTLRNQFIKETKDIETVLGQTSILRSAFNDGVYVNEKGEKKRVGSDQALVMTFNKILDPTSVVRESEFNRTGQALGAVESLFGWLNKLDEGGAGLTDDGRKAIYKMSEVISRGKLLDKFQLISDFDRLGEMEGVNSDKADLIIPGFSSFRDDYVEWKRDPDAFVDKLVDELNATLKEAKLGEVSNSDSSGQASSVGVKSVKLPNGKSVNIGSTFKTKDGRRFRVVGEGQYEEVK